jgi:hypothetical protein
MHLVNSSDPSLSLGHESRPAPSLLRWLPAVLLIGAMGAIFLLGRAEKPADEVSLLNRLANSGDTGAEIQLGTAYKDGLYGLEKNAGTAFTWLKRAADAGDPYAENQVANAYAKGLGVAKDMQQAKIWWHKAIKDGNKDARLQLGEELVREGHLNQAKEFLE